MGVAWSAAVLLKVVTVENESVNLDFRTSWRDGPAPAPGRGMA
ncbi:hypothetical protein BPNSA17_46940 [Bordetella petrii]